jgi:aerobic carbon-monoxide dehydrogenase medium subunit
VIPVAFDYVKATSVADAVSALGEGGEDAKVLSGGQSLLPVLRLRLSAPTLLVDVSRVEAMRGVTRDGDALVIGAATTHHDVMTDAEVRQHAPLLAQAVGTVADPAVRHRGTLGGALSHADPAGDLGSVALALEVELVISGPSGSRTVAAKDFFVDFLETALQPGEILTQVRVPVLGDGWGFHYEKFQRVAQAWSIVGVAAAVHRSNGSIDQARIGLTNMGSTPLRAATTETALVGGDASVDAIKAAAAHAADGTSPASDLNGKADYREHLARVLTARAVATAAGI